MMPTKTDTRMDTPELLHTVPEATKLLLMDMETNLEENVPIKLMLQSPPINQSMENN
jgi:hypothetical protein